MLAAEQKKAAEREAEKIELESLARMIAGALGKVYPNLTPQERLPLIRAAKAAKEFLQHSRP
jgi:hypothetical protein